MIHDNFNERTFRKMRRVADLMHTELAQAAELPATQAHISTHLIEREKETRTDLEAAQVRAEAARAETREAYRDWCETRTTEAYQQWVEADAARRRADAECKRSRAKWARADKALIEAARRKRL